MGIAAHFWPRQQTIWSTLNLEALKLFARAIPDRRSIFALRRCTTRKTQGPGPPFWIAPAAAVAPVAQLLDFFRGTSGPPHTARLWSRLSGKLGRLRRTQPHSPSRTAATTCPACQQRHLAFHGRRGQSVFRERASGGTQPVCIGPASPMRPPGLHQFYRWRKT